MASKKKPVVVTITKSRHKTQPFSVTIDKPGSSEPYTMKERYTRRSTARLGALRNLSAMTQLGTPINGGMHKRTAGIVWFAFNRHIVFRYIDRTKSSTKKK